MKLKNLVAACLAAFGFTLLFIVIIGLWINPGDKNAANTTNVVLPENQTTSPVAQNSDTKSSSATSNTSPTTTKPSTSTSTTSGTTKPTTGGTTTSGGGSTGGTGGTGGGNTNPPPPPPACGSAGGSCTAAQVATHNSQTNCWIIYGGNYFIVTSYVSQHPGGKSVFNSNTCGHDITAYLSGSQSAAGQKHTHSADAYRILNSYKVGAVSG